MKVQLFSTDVGMVLAIIGLVYSKVNRTLAMSLEDNCLDLECPYIGRNSSFL